MRKRSTKEHRYGRVSLWKGIAMEVYRYGKASLRYGSLTERNHNRRHLQAAQSTFYTLNQCRKHRVQLGIIWWLVLQYYHGRCVHPVAGGSLRNCPSRSLAVASVSLWRSSKVERPITRTLIKSFNFEFLADLLEFQ